MEIRITFESEIYIKGKNLDEIREKWENIELYPAETIKKYKEGYVDFCSAERVDDDSYEEIFLNEVNLGD